MEFITLPPEVTSALIHSGPGAESLIEASRVWQQLGMDLDDVAGSYSSVLASLTADWHGPATLAMVDAAGPYVVWLRGTALQCMQVASSAQTAAAAFGSTLAAVVPPAQVSANRTQLARLLATNGFGKNVAAIAATEHQYENMWVNNSAAMYRYETASAQATALQLFSSPPSIVDPGASAAQAEAVQTATATSAGTAGSNAAAAAQAMALPADAVPPPVSPVDQLLQFIGVTFDPNQGWFGLANTYANQFVSSGFPINMLSYFAQFTSAQALSGLAPDVAEGLSEGESALGGAVGGLADAAAALQASAISPAAALGTSVSLGTLSAPPAATAVLASAHMPAQLASAATPLPVGDADAATDFSMMPPLMAPPISAGSGWRKRKETKYEDLAMGLEVKGNFIPRSPSAG